MNIRGLSKTSLVDYPGRVTAVVFTGGCNLHCAYCHNPELALNSSSLSKIDEGEVLAFLKKRRGLIDGVTVTGGEPSIDRGLIPFLGKVRELGLLVKLDTNGSSPGVIRECLSGGLADYIAMDVKTSPAKYKSLTGVDLPFEKILRTLDAIRESGVEYEIRTTCVPGLVTIDDISLIGEETGRVAFWYLQQFVNVHSLLDPETEKLSPYPVPFLQEMRDEALKFSDRCVIRGI